MIDYSIEKYVIKNNRTIQLDELSDFETGLYRIRF